MLIYDLPQGSDAWHKLRLGVPTTSNFSKIITPSGKKSQQFNTYMNKLIAELITGEKEEVRQTDAMLRGVELEPEAVVFYERKAKVKTKEIGFVTTDCGRIGCSPDRLVGKDGLLEIKCPGQSKHTENLISGVIDPQYIPQVQGQMFVTGRDWCDWASYYPGLPASIVRVQRDDVFITSLEGYLGDFIEEMDTKIDTLKAKGVCFAAKFETEAEQVSY